MLCIPGLARYISTTTRACVLPVCSFWPTFTSGSQTPALFQMRALRRERRAAQQKRDEAAKKRAEKEARRTQAQRLREEQRAQRGQQRQFREAEAVRLAAERAAVAEQRAEARRLREEQREQQRQIRTAEAARRTAAAAERQEDREIARGYKNACRPFEPRLLTGTIERDDYSPNNNRHFIGEFGSVVCDYCDALLWPGETSSLCCNHGKTVLPPLPTLPPRLERLFQGVIVCQL